jgi:hypothetical protein
MEAGRQPPHEREVDHLGDAPHQVIQRHALFQVDLEHHLRREQLLAQHRAPSRQGMRLR